MNTFIPGTLIWRMFLGHHEHNRKLVSPGMGDSLMRDSVYHTTTYCIAYKIATYISSTRNLIPLSWPYKFWKDSRFDLVSGSSFISSLNFSRIDACCIIICKCVRIGRLRSVAIPYYHNDQLQSSAQGFVHAVRKQLHERQQPI